MLPQELWDVARATKLLKQMKASVMAVLVLNEATILCHKSLDGKPGRDSVRLG